MLYSAKVSGCMCLHVPTVQSASLNEIPGAVIECLALIV